MTSYVGKPFFELLPAEIRDQIYDATMFQNIQRQKFNFQFQAPCLHLRLVSRQFKDEYDSRSIWGTNLKVSFREASAKRFWTPHAPRLASKYTSIELNCLLGKHSLACKWSEWEDAAVACYRLILRLAPEGLQNLEVYLVWDSVRMLKDCASQRPPDFLHRLNYLIKHPEYGVREDISDSGIVIELKLRYGGIPLLNTPVRSKCDALGAERLKEPVTLGVWSAENDCFLLEEDGISERLRLETVVEAAIQAETGKGQLSDDGVVDISEDQILQGRGGD